MNSELCISRLEKALNLNKNCAGGLLANTRVFETPHGPSGGPEILALIYADDLFGKSFWYGHVVRHPHKPGVFVALLAWTTRFVNAQTITLLFRRLDHWTRLALEYQPCTVQSEGDAYAECPSFEEAVGALEIIISRFEWDKRSGYEGSEHQHDRTEMRIVDIYGVSDVRDLNGVSSAVPTSRDQPL
jgi:hypothetical protein